MKSGDIVVVCYDEIDGVYGILILERSTDKIFLLNQDMKRCPHKRVTPIVFKSRDSIEIDKGEIKIIKQSIDDLRLFLCQKWDSVIDIIQVYEI